MTVHPRPGTGRGRPPFVGSPVAPFLLRAIGLCLGLLAAGQAEADLRPLASPFDYFSNSWSCLGLKDYPHGTRVSPTHELLLDGEVRLGLLLGREAEPIPQQVPKTLYRGYLPAVEWRLTDGRTRYQARAFAVPLPGDDEEARWVWPIAGPNYVNVVQVTAERRAGIVGLRLLEKGSPLPLQWQRLPNGLARATHAGKTYVIAQVGAGEQADAPYGFAARPAPGRPVTLWIPFTPLEQDEALQARAAADPNADGALRSLETFWESLLARGTELVIPERKVLDTYRASLIYQFIGNDLGEVHAGEGFYDALFLRDGAYQIWSLALAGYLPEARQALDLFRKHQTKEGQFVTQEGQLDAHGYALWALAEYYWLTRDREWLAAVYPQVQRAVAWLKQARAQAPADSPFAGLLPAAVADGENLWDGQHHIVGSDLWGLRGLLCAVEMARALGRTAEATQWSLEAAEYQVALRRAAALGGQPYLPPSWEGVGTHWGNLESLFPTPLFRPDDPRVVATLTEVRHHFGGGYLEGTIRWSPGAQTAIHPYLSQFVTNAEIVRGNQAQAVRDFYAFLLHTTATHAFPEGVYPERRQAWSDTIPHLWAAALYQITLRNLLLREYQDELHLSSAVPAHWLDPGRTLRIAAAPTRFGTTSVTWRASRDTIAVAIDPPREVPPRCLVLHLPVGLRLLAATADTGQPVTQGDGVVLPPNTRRVTLRVRRQRVPRVDYARAVQAYQARAARGSRPIPGLVRLPLATPLPPEECVLLDLAPYATTDPFAAPFNVPDPGHYRFNGLRSGVQSVAGVAFQVLDLAASGGRGVVVLQGAEACAPLPSSILVPVNRRARHAYFLGNVSGWSPADGGAGEWGAIAEYVIHYADGTTQRVPLISGRTVDDWASPPSATEVVVGLRGEPWHLNVLGVKLRDKKIRAIEFRDLGTPAAPLLAAITLWPK